MHSFEGNNGWNFFFNGDFSGDIHIYNSKSGEEIGVDGEDLLDFAKFAVGSQIVSLIEDEFM